MKQNEKALLLSMCIGDGYITKPRGNNKNSALTIKHCLKQKEYLVYKMNLMNSILGGKPTISHDVDNSGYPSTYFTKSNKYFANIRKTLYVDDKKFICRHHLDRFNEHCLAIWYMDDGGLSTKRRNGKIHGYELFLNTHVSKDENQIIIDYFNEVWDIRFTQVKNKGSYRLRMGGREAFRFLDLIREYVLPIFDYKTKMISPRAPNTLIGI